MLSAQQGHAAVVSTLLGAGAEIDKARAGGWTALLYSAQRGHADVVSALLAAGADLEKRLVLGSTALILAAQEGQAAVASVLLAAGARVDTADADGQTALLMSAWGGHVTVVSALLAAGAEVDRVDATGDTALINAARNGHAAAVSALVKAGANVLFSVAGGGTALRVAAACSHPGVVKVLLEHPAIHSCVSDAEDVIGVNAEDDGEAEAEDAEAASESEDSDAASDEAEDSDTASEEAEDSDAASDEAQDSDDASEEAEDSSNPEPEAEEEDVVAARTASVRALFKRWHLGQALCAAARAPAVRGSAALPPNLAAALNAAVEAGLDGEKLFGARDMEGLTALGGAAAAGASKAVVVALVASGCNASVPGDLAGTSAGALAARAGQRQAADWLYRAATKAVAKAQPLFRNVRSMLVVGTSGARAGRPFLPVDVLNKVMDCCATPDKCWFAEAPLWAATAFAGAGPGDGASAEAACDGGACTRRSSHKAAR
jgi:ankyrin repeat protein